MWIGILLRIMPMNIFVSKKVRLFAVEYDFLRLYAVLQKVQLSLSLGSLFLVPYYILYPDYTQSSLWIQCALRKGDFRGNYFSRSRIRIQLGRHHISNLPTEIRSEPSTACERILYIMKILMDNNRNYKGETGIPRKSHIWSKMLTRFKKSFSSYSHSHLAYSE